MKGALDKVRLERFRLKQAEERFIKAVELAYPIGARVGATIGRARVYGPVLGYGGGNYAGYIVFENERTGKERCIYVGDRSLHDVEVDVTTAPAT